MSVNPSLLTFMAFKLNSIFNPSQDSSVGSISAWYQGRPGFKSRQGREFFNENKAAHRGLTC